MREIDRSRTRRLHILDLMTGHPSPMKQGFMVLFVTTTLAARSGAFDRKDVQLTNNRFVSAAAKTSTRGPRGSRWQPLVRRFSPDLGWRCVQCHVENEPRGN